jgi:hypothetical protein
MTGGSQTGHFTYYEECDIEFSTHIFVRRTKLVLLVLVE